AAVVALGLCLSASGRVVFASEQGAPQAPQAPTSMANQAVPAGAEVQVSVDEAVRLALQNNLGIQAARLSPQAQAFAVAQTRANYAPTLFANTNKNSSSTPADTSLSGSNLLTNAGFRSNAGVAQALKWGGGNYQVSLDGARTTTTNRNAAFNPNISSNFNFNYTQPLLRNFTMDATRQQLALGQKQSEIVDVQLQQQITQTARSVRNAYYDLVGAIGQLDVARASLQLAQQQLKDNQTKVEVGTMAPIDIIEAQAEVSQREEAVIVNEAQIKTLEDALRTLVMNPSQPDFWTARLVPTEQPTLTAQPIDVDAAIKNALANRTDLVQARKQLEQTDITIKFAKNQRLPAVNAIVNYGLAGVGGTQRSFTYDPITGLPTGESTTIERSFADALRNIFGNDYKTWSVQFQVSYPIGTSAADAGLAQGRVQRQQEVAQLQQLETQVVASVRDAARQVDTSLKRVEATKRAREFAERRYEAEQKRMTVGLSTTFQLFQAQRDLSNQKQAEVNAIIAYNRALVNFEAVQTVPLAGR
ncbi:MAG TPA: TolC family protein, partial [Vicinamibacterales bacterium]